MIHPSIETLESTTVYRKTTHTNQYLHWDSHHNLFGKYSEVNTITHGARTVCTNPQLLQKEKEHIRVPARVQVSQWSLTRLKIKDNHNYNTKNQKKVNNKDKNINMLVPHSKGLSESF